MMDDDDANDDECNYDDDDESDEEYHWPKLIESTVKTRSSPWFHIVSLWRGEEHWYLIYMIMINMMVMMSAYITTTTTTTNIEKYQLIFSPESAPQSPPPGILCTPCSHTPRRCSRGIHMMTL